MNSIGETNGLSQVSFDSSNSCKRLRISRRHELHESKLPFVSLSNLSVLYLLFVSAHVSGVIDAGTSLLTPGRVRFSCSELWAMAALSLAQYVRKAHPATERDGAREPMHEETGTTGDEDTLANLRAARALWTLRW